MSKLPRRTERCRGLTTLELVIVLAIIATLASVIVLSFSDFVRKANHGFTKGSLNTLRGALRVYYADNDGYYPTDLQALTAGRRYLKTVPRTRITPFHEPREHVVNVADTSAPADTAGWIYGNVPGTSSFGRVLVDCTHTDSKGTLWTAY